MEDAASASAGVMLGGAGRPVPFPVVFFDGECETGIGELVVHPAMDFKAFQSILSRKIGISPHQFTVYITDGNNPRNRVPVTGIDFSAVSRENDCFFLVVLKRSRRWRTRRGRKVEPSHATKKEPPANAMLLRRGDGGGNNSTETGVFAGLDELERRVRDLQMEKERYLATLGSANLRIARESRRLVCEECENAKDVGFHRCVYDAVTFGFRSHAGPIARPGKGSDH
ncbi:Nudix hydrolase [Hibiscus syriacus]|uniref:Nudix hydrolase n=1 Tax=Hibiscus syriacus TaxID=106335 RepID=A0A6A2YMR4_HIBSY|nr:Nudix hydrolase [Hibiscus syriacus]